jgi:antibiotic biosynthesis monooxygenase (ABM) superfamily enzyme
VGEELWYQNGAIVSPPHIIHHSLIIELLIYITNLLLNVRLHGLIRFWDPSLKVLMAFISKYGVKHTSR